MAPRKRCRSVKVINKDYSKLTLNDVLCPICRNILFEPVSLPCNHGFCLPCFEGTVANSNLTCPLCRIRFASWHRIATKENKIVDECLWLAVKKLFPQLVQNRINGVDNTILEENSIKLATPGDIRKEYEEEKRKELLEIEKLRVAEAKASEDLINKIRQDEDLEQSLKEASIRKDEKIARKLSEQLNSKICQLQLETPKKGKPLDKYLVNVKKWEKKDLNVAGSKKHVTKILCQDKYPTCVISTSKQGYEDKKHTKNGALNSIQKDIVLPSIYFFQPIEIIKASSHKSPIRIPVKQQRTNVIKIVAPKGTIALIPNVISAFAKVCDSPPTILECSPIRKTKEEPIKRNAAKKRKLFSDTTGESKSANTKTPQKADSSPSKVSCQRKSTRLLALEPASDSSPFRGFKSTVEAPKGVIDCDVLVSNNNVVVSKKETEKIEQERKDLEFAKKLQEELNQMRWYSTRSSIPRNSNFCKKQRQIKLDEIIKCRGKVK